MKNLLKQLLIGLGLIMSIPIILFAFLCLDYRSNPRLTNSEQYKQQYKDKDEKALQPKKLEKTEFDKVLEKHTTKTNPK